MGKLLNFQKVQVPEISPGAKVPSMKGSFHPSLGERMKDPEGPLPWADNYRGEDAPTLEMRIIPDLKKDKGLQYTDLGAARQGEIYRQSEEFTPFTIEGESLVFGEMKKIKVDPSLEAVNRELAGYVSIVPELMGVRRESPIFGVVKKFFQSFIRIFLRGLWPARSEK